MGWMHWIQRGLGRRSFGAVAAVLAIGAAGVLTSLPVSAQQTRPAGISGTKHNLGSGGAATNNKFSATAEICVFCHTPHGADTTAAVPLWNRTLTGSTYQTYDSLGTTSLDGKTATVGSVSVACLSCHDGVQSMSAVINAPGSGRTNAAWTAGTWSGTTVQASGTFVASATAIANLGTDLRNDHPIGIQYGGGGYTATGGATGATKDVDFIQPSYSTIGTLPVWWVDTEATKNNTRQKTDMILYTRAAGSYTGQTVAEPFVECASCHDPHSSNATFLRIANTGSAVCLSCHVK